MGYGTYFLIHESWGDAQVPLWSPSRPLSGWSPRPLSSEPGLAVLSSNLSRPTSRSLVHSLRRDRKKPRVTVRLRKAKGKLDWEAIAGYGCVRETIGARDGHPALQPTIEFWLCSLYKQPSSWRREGEKEEMGREGVRRDSYTCEPKAELEHQKASPTEDGTPSALSSSSPSTDGCGVPKWVPSGSTKWLPSRLGAPGC